MVSSDMLKLDILNPDTLGEVFSFIPLSVKRTLNKTYYTQSPPPSIAKFDSFFRTIIRIDAHFIFYPHLAKNYKLWRSIKGWHYKNMKFFNYIEYIRHLCCHYNSQKCKAELSLHEEKIKPNRKKKYKKMKIRNIRWNN